MGCLAGSEQDLLLWWGAGVYIDSVRIYHNVLRVEEGRCEPDEGKLVVCRSGASVVRQNHGRGGCGRVRRRDEQQVTSVSDRLVQHLSRLGFGYRVATRRGRLGPTDCKQCDQE